MCRVTIHVDLDSLQDLLNKAPISDPSKRVDIGRDLDDHFNDSLAKSASSLKL